MRHARGHDRHDTELMNSCFTDDGVDEHGRPGFRLLTGGGSAPVRLRLHGEHHVTNALAAAALAVALEIGPDTIAAGLGAASSS